MTNIIIIFIISAIFTFITWLALELLCLIIIAFVNKTINPIRILKYRFNNVKWVGDGFLIIIFLCYALMNTIVIYQSMINDLQKQIDQLEQNTTMIIETKK